MVFADNGVAVVIVMRPVRGIVASAREGLERPTDFGERAVVVRVANAHGPGLLEVRLRQELQTDASH